MCDRRFPASLPLSIYEERFVQHVDDPDDNEACFATIKGYHEMKDTLTYKVIRPLRVPKVDSRKKWRKRLPRKLVPCSCRLNYLKISATWIRQGSSGDLFLGPEAIACGCIHGSIDSNTSRVALTLWDATVSNDRVLVVSLYRVPPRQLTATVLEGKDPYILRLVIHPYSVILGDFFKKDDCIYVNPNRTDLF